MLHLHLYREGILPATRTHVLREYCTLIFHEKYDILKFLTRILCGPSYPDFADKFGYVPVDPWTLSYMFPRSAFVDNTSTDYCTLPILRRVYFLSRSLPLLLSLYLSLSFVLFSFFPLPKYKLCCTIPNCFSVKFIARLLRSLNRSYLSKSLTQQTR